MGTSNDSDKEERIKKQIKSIVINIAKNTYGCEEACRKSVEKAIEILEKEGVITHRLN